MDDIVRSIARSFELLASEASDSEELIQGICEAYPEATPVEVRRGALFAITRPEVDLRIVNVIYNCAIRLRSRADIQPPQL